MLHARHRPPSYRWQRVVESYKAKVEGETGRLLSQDPHEQLWGAIGAVFTSRVNAHAVTYRRLNTTPEAWGTAATV